MKQKLSGRVSDIIKNWLGRKLDVNKTYNQLITNKFVNNYQINTSLSDMCCVHECHEMNITPTEYT